MARSAMLQVLCAAHRMAKRNLRRRSRRFCASFRILGGGQRRVKQRVPSPPSLGPNLDEAEGHPLPSAPQIRSNLGLRPSQSGPCRPQIGWRVYPLPQPRSDLTWARQRVRRAEGRRRTGSTVAPDPRLASRVYLEVAEHFPGAIRSVERVVMPAAVLRSSCARGE